MFTGSSPNPSKNLLIAAIVALGVLFGSLGTASAQGPQGHTFGAGIMIGEPSGLTVKQWLNASNAFDVHLAFDFTDEAIAIFADYLYHFDVFRLRSNVQVELPIYVGIGGKLLVDANDNNKNKDAAVGLGLRIPIGISVLFKRAPLEIFVEIAPGLDLIPATDPEVDGGVGIRYYF